MILQIIPIPEPVKTVLYVLFALIVVIALLNRLEILGGRPLVL
jgi:hypothetical protein